ncbi:MAG: hypothetical protein PF541_12915 [Prolixibacteraceae bacterium]|jgi:hypothetical protein|nr:hypothetical protein [Prolixibacteraceae bacterium]
MKIAYQLLLLTILLSIIGSCDQDILRSDSESLKDISLSIHGLYSLECEPGIYLNAEGASYKLFLPNDTLSGVLDAEGYDYQPNIPNSKNGLADVKLILFMNGKQSVPKTIDILCCDTELKDSIFDISCMPPDTINCSSLNREEQLNISSEYLDCVKINDNELVNNSFSFICSGDLLFTWDASIFNNKNIWVEGAISSTSNNETSLTLQEGELFVVYFNLDNKRYTDERFEEVFEFEVSCLNEDGSVGETGSITYTLTASFCDPTVCECPVADGFTIEEDISFSPVLITETKEISISLEKIIENVGINCSYRIDSIVPSVINGAWFIDTDGIESFIEQGKTKLDVTFTPIESIEYKETFVVYASTIPNDYPEGESQCSFNIELIGKGCENTCPQIRIATTSLTSLKTPLNNNNLNPNTDPTSDTLSTGQLIDFTSDYIYHSMNVVSNECVALDILTTKIAIFNIEMPKNIDVCSDYEYEIVTSGDEDEFFVPPLVGNMLTVTGLPPSSDLKNASYILELTLLVHDPLNDKLVCSQRFVFEKIVTGVPIVENGILSILNFSETQNLFHINLYDESRKGTMGEVEAKTQYANVFGFINGNYQEPIVEPYTFYIEKDRASNQLELYLINSSSNDFEFITRDPIKRNYANLAEFKDDYFNGGYNNILNKKQGNLTWGTPVPRSIGYPNGVDLEEGAAYVLWDPNSIVSVKDDEISYCNVALLYIEEVGDNDKIPGVKFYIQYPVGTINPANNLKKKHQYEK